MSSAKKLGFGLMRLPLTNPEVDTSIDIDQCCKMTDTFLERGFNYFDTAWMYHNFTSEKAVKEFLINRHPRESFTLTSKLHSGFFNDLEGRDRIFNEQLEKTGAGYFDYYLIHDVNHGNYDRYLELDCFNWLKAKKEAGLVKHIGFSFHGDAPLLERVLTEQTDIEFVQLQINYLDWESDNVQSRRCYELCEKFDKQVIVMEPVKGGNLANLPEYIAEPMKKMHPDWSLSSWAVRFAASHKNIFMVLSGMSSIAQLEDNTSYMQDFEPLNDEEIAILMDAAEKIRKDIAVPCTGCSYCTSGCPMQIAIPKYFELYNNDKKLIKEWGWKEKRAEYEELTKTFGCAGECIGCGQCEGICPQHLPIVSKLQEVAAHYGK
ncbi:MAG: aldo/keto reductase [Lachnospiraceae bacterium]|nr:aldo/keto reductase [Lachnospiraceae bacterium]